MPQPNLYCAAGYFCRHNATSATPDQGDDANICPVGHYCPEGTGEPVNCPLGTFGNDTGLFWLELSTCNVFLDYLNITKQAGCVCGF